MSIESQSNRKRVNKETEKEVRPEAKIGYDLPLMV